MATVALESIDRRQSESEMTELDRPDVTDQRNGALKARMRRCLILRQGARPLRPPAPFPFCFMLRKGGNLSRVRKPRPNNGRALDKFPPFRRILRDKGKGACVGGGRIGPPVGRPRDFRDGPGPKNPLTSAGLLMEAATVSLRECSIFLLLLHRRRRRRRPGLR